ncbi:putative ribonuclease H-like domain-containing protein [Tanacetum coccineum]|uniref:Ribonuclease H-like domain-containing protein n=1 Tax=Tanacetum coccineum TaxID=301880 RepID=A0ABQ5A9F0_9ASTR
MLADSLLPIPFWAEAVNTACYVLNRVLVTKPQNKTPYELLIGKPPSISFMRPFGCPLTILNTLDPLGKFDGKSDEGYLLGYSTTSKAFRVYNKRTKRVEENLHIDFLEYQPNVGGSGPDWMFDLDFLTNTMNYIPVSVENQITVDAGTQESYVAGSSGKDKEPTQEYILLPLHPHRPRIPVEDVIQDAQEKSSKNAPNDKGELDSEDIAAEQALKDDLERMVAQEMVAQAVDDATRQAFEEEKRKSASTKRAAQATSINKLNTGRPSVNTANTPYVSSASTPTSANVDVSNAFLNDGIFSRAYDDDDVGAEANFNNIDHTIDVSLIPTLRIHKVYLKDQILGDPKSVVQTRGKIQKASLVQQALVIGTKWVFRNKRDERSIVVKNKARLVAQGFRQEEGIDYDKNFAHVARIEAIMLFLAFASFMGFLVYQMDVKSAILYGTIEEELYVHQPLGFVDPAHPDKDYKVIKALYDLHQAPRAWYETLSSFLLENGFRRGTIDNTLFIKKNKSDIMLVQVYVDDIIFGSTTQSMCTEFEDCMHKQFQMSFIADIFKKFDFCSIKTATTLIESNKPMVKDEYGVDVDVHIYRSMIGSLKYMTASRPDIMFAVCACARFQVTPKASHLNAVKRIFRYLKYQPKLWLWYPRDFPFELEAFLDSDYEGASLDRKSTTGGCQFLGRRLISWQCKKQTIMVNSTTEAEYVAAANCFKNPVYHSRTKHIEIRHHFIRDCYKKRLIDVVKIYTDNNVADLLTKGFDVTRFNFLVLELILLRNSMDLRMDGSCASNFSHIWVMTTLKYSDKHNMVAFLKKPNESVGFTKIVDFLKGTSLRYALTHNPTIYDSLVKQFWQTATVRTLANGTPELVASIDNKEYTITEASVRSKLQLADAAGISNLPDAEIYDGLATLWGSCGGITYFLEKRGGDGGGGGGMGDGAGAGSGGGGGERGGGRDVWSQTVLADCYSQNSSDAEIYDGLATLGFLQMILGITTENNGKYLAPTLTKKLFANMKRGYAGDYVPLLPAMLAGAAEDQADEATTIGVRVGTEGDTTTTSGLDAGLDSGNIHESPLRSHEAPLHEGHTLGSVEDSLKLKELMVLVPKLVTRIANLEKELHQTKTTYGKSVFTLVERVKSLEVSLKRKTNKVVVFDSEDEETENQGRKIQDIDDDPLVSLVRESMKEKDTDFVTPTKISASGEVQEQDISPTTLEAAKTLSQVISQKAKSTDKGIRYKRKTRSKSIEKDISTDLDADIEVNPGSEDFNTGNEDFNTGSLGVSTGSGPVSTPSVVQTINVTIPSPIKSQREGKAPMTTEEIQATKRTKAQIQQEEAGLAEAMRLQALQEEEAARQVHLDALIAKRISEEEELLEQQKKRKAEVQEAAQYYTEEDWDTIRAKLEANAELTKSLQGESMTSEDFAKRMVEMINQKKKFYAEQKAKARRSKPMT